MAHIKNYNPGQLRLDLPSANYIYELPLFSIGDTRGSLGISLVYNDKIACEAYNGYNEFKVAPGYKLNLQKKLLFHLGHPQYYIDSSGKEIPLTTRECYKRTGDSESELYKTVYTFTDKSQRIIRPILSGYEVEYPDGSREIFNTGGLLYFCYNKYDELVLKYTYSGIRVTSIEYYNEKKINIAYNSNNCVSSVSYAGSIASFEYTVNGINVTHSAGDVTVIELNGYNFCAKSGDSASSFKKATKLTRNSAARTLKISDIVYENSEENEFNHITYKFPDYLSYSSVYNQVEITDFYGVKNRVQYFDESPIYSYEITGSNDVEFIEYGTIEKYTGAVQILGEEPNVKNIHTGGSRVFRSGLSMRKQSDNFFIYDGYDYDIANTGYYLISGWVKITDTSLTETTIDVSNLGSAVTHIFPIDSTPYNQWKYFCFTVKAIGQNVTVSTFPGIVMNDLRISFQKDVATEENEEKKYFIIQEDGVIYHGGTGNSFIPLSECDIKVYANGTNDDDTAINSKVYFEDLLRNKINYKLGKNKDEVVFDKGSDVISKAETDDLRIVHNGTTYYLSNCYLAKRVYVEEYGYVTDRIVDDSTDGFLVYETMDKNANVISRQVINNKLDIISATSKGVTTAYVRDALGRITSETVKNSSNVSLYTRYTSYGTDTDGNPTVTKTDEYGKSTVQTIDPVWGAVIKTTLPDGSVITNEYDDDKCAVTKISVTDTSVRSNTFGYTDGSLSSLATGALTYGFSYKGGELSAVTKNSAGLEEHEYTQSSVSSYYPSKTISSYSRVTNLDKYGRITSVAGEITNEYDVLSIFDASGNRTPVSNNASSLLVTFTDEVTDETTRYIYDISNKLTGKIRTDKNDLTATICTDEFTYDARNRLTSHKCTYDSATGRSVCGEIVYRESESNINADDQILQYNYKYNDLTRTVSTNTYDSYNRISEKTVIMGGSIFEKKFNAPNTRVLSITETRSNSHVLANTGYSYDSLGRISSVTDKTDNSLIVNYTYDKYGQLIRENNVAYGATYEYIYDDIGNITNVKKYSLTIAPTLPINPIKNNVFIYNSANKDRLIAYNGSSISYNTYGYVSSYNGFSYSWSKGRLTGITKGNPRLTTGDYESTRFTYDGQGRRKTKVYTFDSQTEIVGSPHPTYRTTYDYDSSGRLIHEYCIETFKGTDVNHTHEYIYLYDESGMIGFIRSYDGSTYKRYYYRRNLMGDVIAIHSESGENIVEYAYDAYGNCRIVSCTDYDIGNYNPIRYRGYYYDRETQLYYLNARYYNPEWRRFISHDDSAYLDPESINGLNLYAYCNNDPVNKYDPTGHFGIWALVAITAASMLIGGTAQLVSNAMAGETGSELWRGVAGAAVGAGVNALALCLAMPTGGASLFIAAGASAIAQTGVDTLETVIRGEKVDGRLTVADLGINFVTTLAGNYLSSKMIPTNRGWFQTKKFWHVFTKPYGQKILLQTAIGAVLSGTVNFIRKNDWSKYKPIIPMPVLPLYPLFYRRIEI